MINFVPYNINVASLQSIRKNIFYNTILTSAYYVFPLIVYPYVSRVLGVANIGLVGFIDSIATYFILFSMMGISIVGVREIARCGEDRKLRKSVFLSLLALHGLLTVAAVIAMVSVAVFIPELRGEFRMMQVGICKLIFNLFLVEWFYRGLEEFRFITYRSLIIRGLYVVSVFIFVKNADDTFTYYFLTMLVVMASALVNMIGTRRFLPDTHVKINLKAYAMPFFTLGAYELLASAYTTLNTSFLGFVSNDTEVGYYATATKLISIITMIYISFSGMLLPRMTSIVAHGEKDRFRKYFRKTLMIIIFFSVPVITVIEIFAPEVVMLLSGPGYEGAVTPLRIMIPFLLVLGMEQLLTIQTLMPLGKIRSILIITLLGAITGIVLNIVLVPRYGAIGSAWVWASAETVIFLSALAALKMTSIFKSKH